MASGRIQHRIDHALQKKAEKILNMLGITPSQANTMFYKAIVHRNSLPFPLPEVYPDEIPNAQLQKAFEEADREEGIEDFEDTNEMFERLHQLKHED